MACQCVESDSQNKVNSVNPLAIIKICNNVSSAQSTSNIVKLTGKGKVIGKLGKVTN